MNVNDSERVAGLLQSRGLEASDSAAEADFVFLNTCAVREKATREVPALPGTAPPAQGAAPGPADRGRRLRGPAGGRDAARARSPRRRPRRHPQSPPRPGAARRGRGHRPGRHRHRPQGRRVRDPGRGDRPREPGPGLRDRDGGLQPRLQLLRGAEDPGPRGQPPARGHRSRGRGPGGAGLRRGHAPGADGQRLPPGRHRLRRPARPRGRRRRAQAPAVHDVAPRARGRRDGGRPPAAFRACAPTSTCRSSPGPIGC